MNAEQAQAILEGRRAHRAWLQSRPCDCAAYPFPHRPGSGQCNRDPKHMLADYCRDCGSTDIADRDHGIGPNEFWGMWGNDVDICPTCLYCDGTDIQEVQL